MMWGVRSRLENHNFLFAIVVSAVTFAVSNGSSLSPEEESLKPIEFSLHKFQSMLFTELDDEVFSMETNHINNGNNQKRRRNSAYDRIDESEMMEETNDLWDHIVEHGWFVSENVVSLSSSSEPSFRNQGHNRGLLMRQRKAIDEATNPFLVCSHSPLFTSASQRGKLLQQILLNLDDNGIDESIDESIDSSWQVVKNQDDETCFLLSLKVSVARVLAFSSEYMFDYSVLPFTDMMKIASQTMDDITFSEWTLLPSTTTGNRKLDGSNTIQSTSTEHEIEQLAQKGSTDPNHILPSELGIEPDYRPNGSDHSDQSDNEKNSTYETTMTTCERRISVQLVSPSTFVPTRVSNDFPDDADNGKNDESVLLELVNQIVADVQAMGLHGANFRRRNLQQQRNNVRNKHRSEKSPAINDKTVLSIQDAFSLTSSLVTNNDSDVVSVGQDVAARRRRMDTVLAKTRLQKWSRALEEGMESNHGCQAMIDVMTTDIDILTDTFDILLNPNCQDDSALNDAAIMEQLESSAYNPACVISLVMGLSVHPQVLHVEAEMPIHLSATSDTKSQHSWITESGQTDYQPFRSAGLTGANQIINIQDTGVDLSVDALHIPAALHPNIEQKWDYSQKVAKYDYYLNGNFGDYDGKHGTKVAAACCGNSLNGDNSGGVAPDSKLHVWDFSKSDSGGLGEPDLFRSLQSMNAWTKDSSKGARISNLSWGSSYRPYTLRCYRYDYVLHSSVPNLNYIAAAGNDGKKSTRQNVSGNINDPASCKNPIAVAASSTYYNNKLETIDYLASYSSKGPTKDGRRKPDLVAVGTVKLLDAWRSGTSYATPVVSGAAAIIRQYFEEGWYPCGAKGCSDPIYPGGALVKAVLMNGAQPLSEVLEYGSNINLDPYDFNQNVGRINLLKSLPLKGSTNRFNLVVINEKELETSGSMHSFIIQADHSNCPSGLPLSVTLTYYDSPAYPGCTKCLIEDLDLQVQELNDKTQNPTGTIIYATSNNGIPDSVNNYEKISRVLEDGKLYKISVKARSITRKTKYSLAATGCFEIKLDLMTDQDLLCPNDN